MTIPRYNQKPNNGDSWLDFTNLKRQFAANFSICKTTVIILLASILFGFVEYLLWDRSHLEDGFFLLLLLLLATFNQLKTPLCSRPSASSRLTSWILLLLAATGIAAAAILSRGISSDQQDLAHLLCKNGTILLLAIAIILRQDGFSTAGKCLPLLLLAIVIIPLYELLLLEFSYPMRLLSTMISVILLRLCSFSVHYDGTSLFWNNQTISITDACSGISLLSLFFLLEYLIAYPEKTVSWKKWGWSSLLLLWVTIGNALRLLMTFLLYRIIGEKVFEPRPHFLLGCFFVVITSLIWFSSFLFKLDRPQSSEEHPSSQNC